MESGLYYGTNGCAKSFTVKAILYPTYSAQFRHSWWYNIPDVFIILSQMII
jgi:hypothetical protein